MARALASEKAVRTQKQNLHHLRRTGVVACLVDVRYGLHDVVMSALGDQEVGSM